MNQLPIYFRPNSHPRKFLSLTHLQTISPSPSTRPSIQLRFLIMFFLSYYNLFFVSKPGPEEECAGSEYNRSGDADAYTGFRGRAETSGIRLCGGKGCEGGCCFPCLVTVAVFSSDEVCEGLDTEEDTVDIADLVDRLGVNSAVNAPLDAMLEDTPSPLALISN
ncbi:hypothetical protein CC78DRAFT_581158 [Lojkania enalia]|uniref:Uncharacterized protein n=1 Tax=Lojkania enalia TaxID=147567 RepID=A0A9P4K6K4_9PLEO|nr:hypothetical protein CC78DRAFT_581158 [Didymosphaeria enalia]